MGAVVPEMGGAPFQMGGAAFEKGGGVGQLGGRAFELGAVVFQFGSDRPNGGEAYGIGVRGRNSSLLRSSSAFIRLRFQVCNVASRAISSVSWTLDNSR